MSSVFPRRSPAARTRTAVVAAAAVVALAVAGCGGGSGGSPGASASMPAPTATAHTTASVALAHSGLGTILVDGQGRTLYLWQADKGTKSMCDGACAGAWPPLTTTKQPVAGKGVSASKLGTTMRSDGTKEVTYNGHPLYTYVGDSAPGQTVGQGSDEFGAEWYVLSSSGNEIVNG